MGFMPTFQADPQAVSKMRPGLYALVFMRATKGSAIQGGHIWFEIESIDREEGTWTGRAVKQPQFPSGIRKGESIMLTLDQVETVSANPP